jgi:acyl carrier protein
MSDTEIDVLKLFQRAAREITGKSYPQVTYQSQIADLGIDSIAVAEMVAFIEDELNIRLPDDGFVRIRTIQDLADMVLESGEFP